MGTSRCSWSVIRASPRWRTRAAAAWRACWLPAMCVQNRACTAGANKSRLEAQVVRIVERLAPDERPAAVAEDFHLGLRARRAEIAPDVRERDAAVQSVTIAAGGDEPDHLHAPIHNGYRRRVGVSRIDEQRDEALLRTRGRLPAQRLAPDEVGLLVQTHKTLERGHEGGVLGRQVGLPAAVAFLEPQALHGIEAEVRERECRSEEHTSELQSPC